MAGVGVPAYGLGSLEKLIASVPAHGGLAWVVIPHQAESVDSLRLVATLGRLTELPVEMAVDGTLLQVDRIYVAPAGRLTTFAAGRLVVAEPDAGAESGPDARALVDSFFVSLAEANGPASIGVILAGMGLAGTAGVTTQKDKSGLLVCERDDTREPDIHPLADPTGLADFVLAAEEVAARVVAYVSHLRESSSGRKALEAKDQVAGQIGRIAAVLRNRTGHDFHGYKHATFLRRIQRRMQVNALDAVESYIGFLREDANEVHHLFQDLLIGVTQFFRDKIEFDVLERDVIPRLFKGKGAGDQVRVWVLGCATGEEAYSLAILMREHMAKLDIVPHVQIFATDIDGRALSVARAGRYPESIAKAVSPERLARWFVKEGATYIVLKELREMCIFSQHNVVKDAPFSRIDLCSCRNLLIYLTSELQDRVIPLFHFALRGESYLFLGSSENVTRQSRLFAPIDGHRRIFRRIDTGQRVLPQFPLSVSDRLRGAGQAFGTRRSKPESQLARNAERIAERYAPAHVLVDSQFDVLSFSGRTGRFIEPAAGMANLGLVNLVHRDLRIDVRAALQRAAMDRAPVRVNGIVMDGATNGERPRVDLIVEPMPGDESPGYVVLFRESEPVLDGQSSGGAMDVAVLRDEHVKRLDAELKLSRERLQATIEELESTNEELKSSNEEYQSLNEELQSANEELETSKEELQSINEELQTVNAELGHRVNELARANSDLKNLLESTQIATVFLDNDLRVKSFTPSTSSRPTSTAR